MRTSHPIPEKKNSTRTPGLADASEGPAPELAAASCIDDVLREQLEYLIGHAEGGDCGCSLCDRYSRVRAALLEIFAEPRGKTLSLTKIAS